MINTLSSLDIPKLSNFVFLSCKWENARLPAINLIVFIILDDLKIFVKMSGCRIRAIRFLSDISFLALVISGKCLNDKMKTSRQNFDKLSLPHRAVFKYSLPCDPQSFIESKTMINYNQSSWNNHSHLRGLHRI